MICPDFLKKGFGNVGVYHFYFMLKFFDLDDEVIDFPSVVDFINLWDCMLFSKWVIKVLFHGFDCFDQGI